MAMHYAMPRMPRAGVGIKADWGDALVRALGAQRPVQVPGMLISKGTYGTAYTPIVQDATAAAGTGTLVPFAVRWYAPDLDDPDKGEWQIYLPGGCATVEQGGVVYPYVPVNQKAEPAKSNDPASAAAVFRWYKIETPKDEDAEISTQGGFVAKSWTVYVHFKPWPRMKASVKAQDKDFKTDKWTLAVADMREMARSGKDGEIKRRYAVQMHGTSVAYKWDVSAPWSVRYEMESDEPDANVKVSLVNQSKVLGRLFAQKAKPTDIKDWSSAWVVVKHGSTEFEVDVKDYSDGDEADGGKDGGDNTKSNDDRTVFQIYEIKDDVPVADYRAAIPDMDFYTNKPSPPEGTNNGASAGQ